MRSKEDRFGLVRAEVLPGGERESVLRNITEPKLLHLAVELKREALGEWILDRGSMVSGGLAELKSKHELVGVTAGKFSRRKYWASS